MVAYAQAVWHEIMANRGMQTVVLQNRSLQLVPIHKCKVLSAPPAIPLVFMREGASGTSRDLVPIKHGLPILLRMFVSNHVVGSYLPEHPHGQDVLHRHKPPVSATTREIGAAAADLLDIIESRTQHTLHRGCGVEIEGEVVVVRPRSVPQKLVLASGHDVFASVAEEVTWLGVDADRAALIRDHSARFHGEEARLEFRLPHPAGNEVCYGPELPIPRQ
mmetsp:Transcript_56511/g.183658  ORF Transcript_56511/g.183658 Transcript_56511/m.183658 type:complete len:219 (-) Transcript_56511:241-897(-)